MTVMMSISYHLLLNFILLPIWVVNGQVAYTLHGVYDERKLAFNPGLPSAKGISKGDCGNKCASIRTCQTFVFEEQTGICHFYKGFRTDNNNMPTLLYNRDNFQFEGLCDHKATK